MSFDFSTLVTDRTQADVSRVKQIAEKIKNGTASESELAEFNSAAMKGAYNHTDLNRVTAAMEALKAKLEGYGYDVPGYQRIKVPHVLPEPEPTSRLPEGYTELTYIESTGTQYIDTGFIPNQNSKMVVDAQFTSVSGTVSFAGSRNSESSDGDGTFFGWISVSGNLRSYYYNSFVVVATADTARHIYTKDKNQTLIDGSLLNTATAQQFRSGIYPIYLFANNEGRANFHASVRIYSCQMYDNGTLTRDYVPCINPDGVVGLYDLVTEAFFGNAGTGVFKCNLDFANYTWEQVIEACQTNTVPVVWSVGDQKTMTINGTDYLVDIIGKNHDEYADGSSTAPLTFQLHDCYGTTYQMNSTATTVGGWTNCAMRTTHLPEILALMPSEVQAGIRAVSKRTGAGGGSSTINTTSDKLFLLSEVEVQGSNPYSVAGEGSQYAWYAAGNDKKKYISGTAVVWWHRSPWSTNDFCVIYNNGNPTATSANSQYGVSFAFCF